MWMGSLCRHMLTYRPATCVLEIGGCCVLTGDYLRATSAPYPLDIVALRLPEVSEIWPFWVQCPSQGLGPLWRQELWLSSSEAGGTCICSGVASLEKVCFHQERRKVHPLGGRGGGEFWLHSGSHCLLWDLSTFLPSLQLQFHCSDFLETLETKTKFSPCLCFSLHLLSLLSPLPSSLSPHSLLTLPYSLPVQVGFCLL